MTRSSRSSPAEPNRAAGPTFGPRAPSTSYGFVAGVPFIAQISPHGDVAPHRQSHVRAVPGDARGATRNRRQRHVKRSRPLSGRMASNQVLADIRQLVHHGRALVALIERRDHFDRIVERLRADIPSLVVLHGGITPKARRTAMAQLAEQSDDEPRLILASGRYLGKGFDDPRLDTLLLTMPIAWKGTVVQYAGRLHRAHAAKRAIRIYDYVDSDVPLLRHIDAKRLRAFNELGYVTAESTHELSLAIDRESFLVSRPRSCRQRIFEYRAETTDVRVLLGGRWSMSSGGGIRTRDLRVMSGEKALQFPQIGRDWSTKSPAFEVLFGQFGTQSGTHEKVVPTWYP